MTRQFTTITNFISNLKLGKRLAIAAAALSIASVTGLTTATASAQSSTQALPTTRAECADWRDYGNRFNNRADCNSYVAQLNNGNGYNGGGGGNGGGGLGNAIRQILAFLSNFISQLFAFLGRIF